MIECMSTEQMYYFLSLVMSATDFLPNGSVKVAGVTWSFDETKGLWCYK